VSQQAMLYRQGDVLLRRVESLPADCQVVPREAGRIVLAHGELTGHAHAIAAPAALATLLQAADRVRFLRLVAGVAVTHEEHAPIALPPGLYEVIRQREWNDSAGDEAIAQARARDDESEERWHYAGD
jgi:hypothetical protein